MKGKARNARNPKTEAQKHTPGPWRVSVSGDSECQIEGCEGRWVATAAARDAALIAAAPDLLEALVRMVEIWEGPREMAAMEFAKAVVQARAALHETRP